MAEAKITTAEGIVVEVHGTPEEVSIVVERLRSGNRQAVGEHRQSKLRSKERDLSGRVLIPSLVDVLREEEFFKTPRGLGEIRKKLADMGHHYPVTTLSGAMQSQAKRRQLRRFKQDGKYVYVSA